MTASIQDSFGWHTRFQTRAAYTPHAYRLLPFRFDRFDTQRSVVTNMSGDYVLMPTGVVHSLIAHTLPTDDPWFTVAASRLLVAQQGDDVAVDLLAQQTRAQYAGLSGFTALHMVVVTLRCDHSCAYCQVSRVSEDTTAYDLTPADADRIVDLIFQGPSPHLKIEFQGGESLLNFPIICRIVERAEAINPSTQRDLAFVIATNLSHITDEMLQFCRDHHVGISTSLDGTAAQHDSNRARPGRDSHARAVRGIERARQALGHDAVSALMTTTAQSLEDPEGIVDAYVAAGFNSIFLRYLAPFGFAVRSASVIGYSVGAWNAFYERALRYIIACNQRGCVIREEHATIILRKMLRVEPCRYVDLVSPASLGIGAVVWNYDGHVYPSDEARMLAAAGDLTFRMGHVREHTFRQLFTSPHLKRWIADTMVETVPGCSTCAFAPWCGSDPVFHHATQGDVVGHRPSSAWCARHMATYRLLVRMLEDEPESAAVLRHWI